MDQRVSLKPNYTTLSHYFHSSFSLLPSNLARYLVFLVFIFIFALQKVLFFCYLLHFLVRIPLFFGHLLIYLIRKMVRFDSYVNMASIWIGFGFLFHQKGTSWNEDYGLRRVLHQVLDDGDHVKLLFSKCVIRPYIYHSLFQALIKFFVHGKEVY